MQSSLRHSPPPRGRYRSWAGVCLLTLSWLILISSLAHGLDHTRFIPVSEIEVGMTGSGLTTFADTTVSRFEVEVLGVLRGWVPGGDLIVVEASGGPLAETGIYRGMSGSPIYFDGRLAGAMAFNLGGFGERAIGGVTPIAEMLPMLDEREVGDRRGAPRGGLAPDRRQPGQSGAIEHRRVDGGPQAAPMDPADIRPIRTPLVMAGFYPETRRAMAGLFEELGCSPVAGGGAGDGEVGAAMRPGAPVGVQIVRGDVSVTTLGTITHVDNERLLAFGHPMFSAGIINMPMTSARVYTVYPSQAISFVIATAVEPRGRVMADRQTGIMGRLGEVAPMMPVQLDIIDTQGRTRQFSFEMVNNKFLVTQFLGYMAFNSFMATEGSFGDVTLDTHMAVTFTDGTVLEFDDVLASFAGPQALAAQVSAPLAGILLSGIETVALERVNLTLRASPEVRLASIEEIVVDRDRLRPGEMLATTVFLRRFEDEREAIHLELEIPASLQPGPVLLRVCSADQAREWEQERAPHRFMPRSLAQYVTLFEEGTARNVMRVSLYTEAQGVVLGGREMMGLPASVFRIMDTKKRIGGRSGSWGRLVHEQAVKTEYQLGGCRELQFEVTRPAVTQAPRRGYSELGQ